MRTLLQLALLITLAIPQAHAQSPPEQTLLQLTNQSRAQYHLAPLTWDPALARAARLHATLTARAGGIAQHQYPGEPDLLTRAAHAGARFSTISENVAGNGSTPAEIHDAWMHSPVHRANILDPHLTAIGIAVVPTNHRDTAGLLFAVEDFSRTVATYTPIQVEAQAQQVLLSRGIQPNPSAEARQDARRACSTGTTSLTQPTLILQWEGPDLHDLPATVLPQLHSRNQKVAIGACPPSESNPNFTTYRIGVLIY